MKSFILLIAVFFLAGCQDHRFTPIDEAKDVKPPVIDKTENPHKTFEKTDETAQKQVMTQAYRTDRKPGQKQLEGAGRLIVEGTLELGENIKDRDFSGFTVYVIAWLIKMEKDGAKPFPLAIGRYEAGKFPFAFSLHEENLMVKSYPDPETKLLLEARLDKDGDAISKDAGDVYGYTGKTFTASATGVKLTLDKLRE